MWSMFVTAGNQQKHCSDAIDPKFLFAFAMTAFVLSGPRGLDYLKPERTWYQGYGLLMSYVGGPLVIVRIRGPHLLTASCVYIPLACVSREVGAERRLGHSCNEGIQIEGGLRAGQGKRLHHAPLMFANPQKFSLATYSRILDAER